ncbi:phosphoribosyltransferase [Actibacterium lipolyticum]|uniref:Putative phosphoribosyl transferase/MT0597 n=1 Tax=Actibacterium lipolyticum TaxID=1524263 RepID=A0A238KQX7_9RHOB|nr:phosphoribosyltransferase family protein [Actibacterium lipolyticum]SMX45259.1 Putative phosphoribosyl transferase/MT0597 [Actibacterium lipolyticum]
MFTDRAQAGEALAEAVAKAAPDNPVVLALPRGGVPVAIPVAKRLNAPLDLLMVRKIGVPHQPEVAAGAVVDGDAHQIVFNDHVLKYAGLTREDFADAIDEKLAQIAERRGKYLGDRKSVPLSGTTAIVVDDGIATGATVKAALKALRGAKPDAIWLAVPVGPLDVLEEMRGLVDNLICLEVPQPFIAVGAHYRRFDQFSDDAVVDALGAMWNTGTK